MTYYQYAWVTIVLFSLFIFFTFFPNMFLFLSYNKTRMSL